jgi:hypothetical protein
VDSVSVCRRRRRHCVYFYSESNPDITDRKLSVNSSIQILKHWSTSFPQVRLDRLI